MSGPQSLKQLIAVNATELGVVNNKLSALTAGDVDLTAQIEANGALIASNKVALDALTVSADGTQTALEAATSGFTTALSDLEGRAYAADEVVRLGADAGIALVRTDLDAEIVRAGAAEAAERARALLAESELLDLLTAEETRAALAEATVEAAVTALVTAERERAQAIEAPLRTDVDAALLSAGKRVFVQTMEFDGAPVAGEYPFCCGAGVPSSAGFGLMVPFSYVITAFAFTCDAAGAVPPTRLEFELYSPSRALQSSFIVNPLHSTNKYVAGPLSQAGSGGSVCVKILTVDDGNTGVPVNPIARYRLSIFIQSTH